MASFLQLNTNRSRAAVELLLATAKTTKADMLLISEPNIRACVGPKWKTDTRKDAAVYVCGNTAIVGHGSGDGYAWVETSSLTIYSCYFSPNARMDEFRASLEQLGTEIARSRKDVVVAGDFNAKSPAWGCLFEDNRGSFLADWAAALDLTALNEEGVHTFSRGDYNSTLDITFVAHRILNRVESWTVLEKETLSDHLCICTKLTDHRTDSTNHRAPNRNRGWRIPNRGHRRAEEALERRLRQVDEVTPAALIEAVTQACNDCFPRKETRQDRREVYWWTQSIAELRRACLKARRQLKREARRAGGHADPQFHESLRAARGELRRAIKQSKRRCWKELCERVNDDVWGEGYQIVTKQFGRALPILPEELLMRVVETLFPQHEPVPHEEIVADEIPLFTESELALAWTKMKTKKSPGPDGVPPEMVRLTAERQSIKTLEAMNYALVNEIFPETWKKGRLVLLKKPGKEDGHPSSYRPLCLLDCFGKLLEQLLAIRLKVELDNTGGLSANQFGFREGKSTIDAVEKVMELVDTAAAGTQHTRKIPAVILLDVANAFNSASWALILLELRKRGVAAYLRRMIQCYLNQRSILVTSEDSEARSLQISSGVPQGSVLGPTLWNVLYDGVLRLEMPNGVTPVAYADDLALVVTGKTEEDVVNAGDEAIRRIDEWLLHNQLQLAPEKTEAIIMAGRRVLEDISFTIRGTTIRPKPKVKYLGVWLDHRRSFQEHTRQAVAKGAKTAKSLALLMANVGGPSETKRRLLTGVVTSVVLYGAPTWVRALDAENARKRIESIGRRMALRICSAYITVSTEAANVIARTPPLELQARAQVTRRQGSTREETRKQMIEAWQQRWARAQQGSWTRRLIPSLEQWLDRKHGEVDFFLTQVLTGHGSFGTYLCRIRKRPTARCIYCEGDIEDTSEHTVFKCPKWEVERGRCWAVIGNSTPETIIERMLESDDNWLAVKDFARTVILAKIADGF